MQQVSRVHVLESLEKLVHDVLLVDLLEDVGTDHRVQVRICTVSPVPTEFACLRLPAMAPSRLAPGRAPPRTCAGVRMSMEWNWAMLGEARAPMYSNTR
jgi:hypothetical protein